MQIRNFIFFICIFCVALIGGCSGSPSKEDKSLAKYSRETLTAGTGLGDLQLGKTTLDGFVNNIGAGRMAFLAGDESGIELSFANNEAAFLFVLSKECQEATGGLGGARSKIGQDLRAFIAQYPKCGEITLSSISMAAGTSKEETFFKGSTDKGVQLWAPIIDSLKHGKPSNGPGEFVAGDAFTDNHDRFDFPSGIYFYYPAGEGPTSAEMQSGAPLSPERQKQIQESANAAAKNPIIKRITIFIPNRIPTYQ